MCKTEICHAAISSTDCPQITQKLYPFIYSGDLWGPLLLCLLLCLTLSIRTEGETKTIITSIFVIMWVGSLVVYLNANFLGSEMTFFQAASLLGYCLFPINVASFSMMFLQGWLPSIFKLAVVGFSFVWASTCIYWFILGSIAFVGEMIPERKRKLALYPIILFYLFLSWFVLVV